MPVALGLDWSCMPLGFRPLHENMNEEKLVVFLRQATAQALPLAFGPLY